VRFIGFFSTASYRGTSKATCKCLKHGASGAARRIRSAEIPPSGYIAPVLLTCGKPRKQVVPGRHDYLRLSVWSVRLLTFREPHSSRTTHRRSHTLNMPRSGTLAFFAAIVSRAILLTLSRPTFRVHAGALLFCEQLLIGSSTHGLTLPRSPAVLYLLTRLNQPSLRNNRFCGCCIPWIGPQKNQRSAR
jgi:hypothetical protein